VHIPTPAWGDIVSYSYRIGGEEIEREEKERGEGGREEGGGEGGEWGEWSREGKERAIRPYVYTTRYDTASSRFDVPKNPIIYRTREDISWDDVVFSFYQKKQFLGRTLKEGEGRGERG